MTNSELFTLAHHKTRIEQLKAIALGRKFSYQVSFSFYLKELTNSQPQKVTVYDGSKKINKACAMVGDYAKPSYVRNGFKVTKQINPSLSVTYNLDTLLHFVISAIAVIIIFALSLQAINLF